MTAPTSDWWEHFMRMRLEELAEELEQLFIRPNDDGGSPPWLSPIPRELRIAGLRGLRATVDVLEARIIAEPGATCTKCGASLENPTEIAEPLCCSCRAEKEKI